MEWVLYKCFTILTWLVALLPLKVLYIFSWKLYYFLYYITGYRRKVVYNNLRSAFPEMSQPEIKMLGKKFYSHLSDIIIEGIKLRHLSEAELHKRFRFKNPELINKYAMEGRDVIATFGHFGNWEWNIALNKIFDALILAVYKPLHNRHFDRYFLKLRSRYGMELVPMSSTLRRIIECRKDGIRTITALLADQTPPKKDIQFWMNFLNQETPVYLGVEKLAAKFNMVVFFLKINKVRRGYYEVEAELISDRPTELEEYDLTRMHMQRLEKHILEKPEYWLWSHRRWKHKPKKNQ